MHTRCVYCARWFKWSLTNQAYCSFECKNARKREKDRRLYRLRWDNDPEYRKRKIEERQERRAVKSALDLVLEPVSRDCRYCFKPFQPRIAQQRYCSHECSKAVKKERHSAKRRIRRATDATWREERNQRNTERSRKNAGIVAAFKEFLADPNSLNPEGE